jgi:methylase of polypeptide subunit release factors
LEPTSIPKEHDASRWWTEHYDGAARQIIDFLAGDGFTLQGKQVADIGSGDGIIDLGIWHHARPAKLIGYDVRPTDVDALMRSAAAAGIDADLSHPDAFTFVKSEVDEVPALEESFDLAYTCSNTDHV